MTQDEKDLQDGALGAGPAPKKSKAAGTNKYAKLAEGPETHFHEGYKLANFDKTYGDVAPDDLVEVANKHFNIDDDFIFLFNARANYLFSVVVPFKFSNIDVTMKEKLRADVRSVLLKPGTEAEQVDAFCKKVIAQLRYNKIR